MKRERNEGLLDRGGGAIVTSSGTGSVTDRMRTSGAPAARGERKGMKGVWAAHTAASGHRRPKGSHASQGDSLQRNRGPRMEGAAAPDRVSPGAHCGAIAQTYITISFVKQAPAAISHFGSLVGPGRRSCLRVIL